MRGHNIKYVNNTLVGHTGELFIDGNAFPFTELCFKTSVKSANVLEVHTFICDAEIDAEMDLIVHGVLVGVENEKRIYECLKNKYENTDAVVKGA